MCIRDRVSAGLAQMETSTDTSAEDSPLNGISDKLKQLKEAGTMLSTAYKEELNPSVSKLDESAVSYTHLDVYKRQVYNT